MWKDGPIFALDLATRAGVASGRPGEKPRAWAVHLKKPNDERGVAFGNLIAHLDAEWRKDRPGLVVKEQPLALQGFANLGNAANVVRMTHGLHAVVEAMCARYGIRCVEVSDARARKFFIGRGRLGDRQKTKQAVIDRCIQLGYLTILNADDDKADAICTWAWACEALGHYPPSELHLFQGEAA